MTATAIFDEMLLPDGSAREAYAAIQRWIEATPR